MGFPCSPTVVTGEYILTAKVHIRMAGRLMDSCSQEVVDSLFIKPQEALSYLVYSVSYLVCIQKTTRTNQIRDYNR